MAATRTITAVDPATGARITRRTARTYVAVVVTGDPAQGHAWAQNWCGRPDLAAKQLAKWGPDSHARLAPVMADPWATPEATPAPAPEATPAPAAPRPTLPGEATPPPAPAALGDAAPALPPLPVAAPADRVAAHRAAAAAGRPVSLAALARDMGLALGLASGGRLPRYGATGDLPARPAPAAAPAGDPLEGQPWDPGTPEARARVALQGDRVATLWPIAQALRGEGRRLPRSWASDGPVMAGEWAVPTAVAILSGDDLRAAAAALAALPPVTAAQARALEACRAALPARSARL